VAISSRLSASQRRQFDDEGFLLVEDVLDPQDDLGPVLDEYADVLEALARRMLADGIVSDTFSGLPFVQRLLALCEASGKALPEAFDFSLPQNGVRPDTPIEVGPAVFRLLTNPRLLDLVEDMIGPEIFSNPVQHIRMKLPARVVPEGCTSGLITRIPWHQDNGVIMPEADAATILTVWLPLVDATIENGCLAVVPRSHLADLQPHCPTSHGLQIPADFVEEERAQPVPMRAGSVLLMTQRTVHSSLDNLTDSQVRISMDLRYQPIGQATGRPAFAPAGFVARSPAHPEQVLHDPAEWAQRWYTLRTQLAAAENQPFNRWSAEAPVCA
jgi:ectoine hydroxylase-related dioxygenase (phytanoyl-CoA dioxygenase family)